jgi:arylsulfatase
VHGFDEFFGNLYHLNAEQEPENPDYPKEPEFKKKFGPRGVLHCWANADGTQKIEDTGPLTASAWRRSTRSSSRPAWSSSTGAQGRQAVLPLVQLDAHAHLHAPQEESQGKTGLGVYPDGMVEHDGHVGQLLKKLDDLGIANDTIVMYSTDNGAEVMSWPDGGATPFRGEKDTNYEGGWRVPCCIRWPGVLEPDQSRTRSSRTPTCCRRCRRSPASPTSSTSSRRVQGPATRPSRCTSTATTCCRS